MKKKDIITLIVAACVFGVASYFVYKMLFPTKKVQTTTSPQSTEKTITGNIDQETLKLISEKKDYGEATLDNIGRTNPFGPLN